MAGRYTTYYERSLQDTATWAVAVVCFVLLAISLLAEHLLHHFEKWLERKQKPTLAEAVEKVKSELMLLGFISLLLTVFQNYISEICVPRDVAMTWRPCNENPKFKEFPKGRRLLELWDEEQNEGWTPRRSLATKGMDYCSEKGDKLAFVTAYGIHQLHIFIFVLAIFHVLFCIITMAIGTLKMRRWKNWEDETKTLEYQYYNDPERFRFARDTSFGRRHLHAWSRSPVTLWIVCFFRQFFGSVTKVDYFALRHGFIMAHLTPESEMRFDFQNYIHKSLDEDFKVVVSISPVIWFTAVLFLLTNTHGWYAYLWMPFIPLIILLVVGTKLQVIITRMGVRIQERGDVVKGTPVVQPGDDLFWFGQPRFILFLIHFVLFQNAFQLAFFAWSTYEYGIRNCFHQRLEDIIIRTSMGVVIQVVCSYVTMPLYALVTQMGTSMKPTIFHDRVATALKSWHHTAKRNAKELSKHSNSPLSSRPATPLSSRPATPEHGSSPMHLLHAYQNRGTDSLQASPKSYHNIDPWAHVGSSYSHDNGQGRHADDFDDESIREHVEMMTGPNVARDSGHTQLDEIEIVRPSEFTFGK